MRKIFEEKTKPLPISMEMVEKAYKKVKSNKGSAGVDKVSIQQFEENLAGNLYKLWNRMASGSYFPPAVKEQEIKKDNGKIRKLGIPTVLDRIAQQVIKEYLEPRLEKEFHESSFGYRPLKSAHQALTCVRENVRKYAWVIDLDITAFFDNVDHEKLVKALDRHAEERWVKMYVKRWLEAPIAKANGVMQEKQGIGTPQGGVISPLLANLYLHYTFDKWMEIHFPDIPFVRYADDIVIHCTSEKQSLFVLYKIKERLSQCNLSIHPDKTNVVYCKDYRRNLTGKKVKFDFLGFSFRPESKPSKHGGMFLGYDCEISKKSYSKIVDELKRLRFHVWAESWQHIADVLNSKIRGWVQYYDKFRYRTLTKVFHRLHLRLMKWIMNRFKRFKTSRKRALNYLKFIHRKYSYLFYHWSIGYHLV
jgi:group II intron reverse transcriptase/maturase